MTYLTNIPFSGESLGQSRPQVQTNFSVLDTTIKVDHVAMNNVGAGKHNKSTYVVQGSDAVTAASEVAVYAKSVAGAARLFQRLESNGTVIPFSPIFTSSAIVAPLVYTEYSFSFGGVIMKYGYITGAANNVTFTFATPFPTSFRSLQLTIDQNLGASVGAVIRTSTPPTNANFTIQTNQPTINFTYFAIGD